MTGDRFQEEVIQLRRHLADDRFLTQQLYTRDSSRFDGSTYRYLVRIELPRDESQLVGRLYNQFCAESRRRIERTRILERFVQRLPREVLTRVEIPSTTASEDSVSQCLARAAVARRFSLTACTPYAWIYAMLSRLVCEHGTAVPPAGDLELEGLLSNYHRFHFQRGRLRCPETWDMARRYYVFDSRGVPFAFELTRGLVERGLLHAGSKFLDIGSGIGTMTIAAALGSPASAAGIEVHPQLARQARSMLRRLSRNNAWLDRRVQLLEGDFRYSSELQLHRFDVIYVYSPLGSCEIELDPIVEHMRCGAHLISERLPVERLDSVHLEPKLCDLFVLRRS